MLSQNCTSKEAGLTAIIRLEMGYFLLRYATRAQWWRLTISQH